MAATYRHPTFSKLRSGEWGVKYFGPAPRRGRLVDVKKADGSVTVAVVASVVWSSPDGQEHLCALDQEETRRVQRNNRPPRGRECRTGGNCSSVGSGRSCGGHDCDGW